MKHLGILEKSGLIIVKREGKHRWNYINPVPIREIYERWVRKYEENWSSYLIQLKNIAESDKKAINDESKKHNTKKIKPKEM